MSRLLVFIPIWLAFMALKFVVAVLGVVAVPLMWPLREVYYDKLPAWTRPWANPEDWTGGPEAFMYTSLPMWWVEKKGAGFWSFYRYHARRNPANGLRSFEWLDLDIDPDKVEYITPNETMTASYLRHYEPNAARSIKAKSIWYLCWQGWQAGFKYVRVWPDLKKDITITVPTISWDKWWNGISLEKKVLLEAGPRHMVIKIGWRVQPSDRHIEIDPDGIRAEDAGFASKGILYRKG